MKYLLMISMVIALCSCATLTHSLPSLHGGPKGVDITFIVYNDMNPPNMATAYLYTTTTGQVKILGDVQPGQIKKFTYHFALDSREYFFKAKLATNMYGINSLKEINSDHFNLLNITSCEWNLNNNLLRWNPE